MLMLRVRVALLVLLLSGCRTPGVGGPTRPRARISLGTVVGVAQGDTAAFLGIPFAAPPIDALRWRGPAPPEPWRGERDAIVMREGCLQLGKEGLKPGGSEDCLYLNVWTPLHRSGAPLPVLVWIHGGFNALGSANIRYHGAHELDGRALSEKGLVVVTLDYRLGPLGFFDLPGVTEGSGNFGLLDQLAALKMVQREIAAFGGDPSRVTVAGSSAGSIDTCALVTSPSAKGLFSAAAMVSWPCVAGRKARVVEVSRRLATAVGCTDPQPGECLRKKSAAEIETALPIFAPGGVGYGPFVDGVVLPDVPMERIKAGVQNHIPILLGTTANEYASILYSLQHTPVRNGDDYLGALRDHFPDADAIAARYPAADFPSPRDALIAVLTDARVLCPVRREAIALARSQDQPVYRYVYEHQLSNGPFRKLGAAHGTDVPFWLGNVDFDDAVLRPEETALASSMSSAFARFIAHGDPSGDGVAWPRTRTGDEVTRLDETTRTGLDPNASRCAFWDAR